MTTRAIEKLLAQKLSRPGINLSSYLLEIQASEMTSAEAAAHLNSLLGTTISAHDLSMAIRYLRLKGFSFRFRDGRGAPKKPDRIVNQQLTERLQQLTLEQKIALLKQARNLVSQAA